MNIHNQISITFNFIKMVVGRKTINMHLNLKYLEIMKLLCNVQ